MTGRQGTAGRLLAAATRLAEEVLLPAAAEADATGTLPARSLDALAEAGLYGLFAPAELGGIARDADAFRIVETLASGCLATTFVWLQHLGVVRAVAHAPAPLRETWLGAMAAGAARAAISQAGVRPGPALLRARRVTGGYLLDGEAPWVTGWGLVDVVHVSARRDDEVVVWALLDAREGPTLAVEPLELVAVNASRTVVARFAAHPVPDERVTSLMPLADWAERDAASLRLNGSLSLGLAARCVRLLTGDAVAGLPGDLPVGLAGELDACRAGLDAASPAGLPAARAAASELALRAAATLTVAAGARGILAGEAAQRLVREAAFLLVFGSRPAIRSHLLDLVRTPPAD